MDLNLSIVFDPRRKDSDPELALCPARDTAIGAKTCVVYFVFNRPRHTRRTFAAIREQRPGKLFIVADGPRSNHTADIELCREVREIVDHTDWPCEAHRNYSDVNLGPKRRISSGLDWAFSMVDKAIVLEDDCLPHPDFFEFSSSLLDRYESDDRVWVITGNNFQDGARHGDAAYYFSKYNHCWGWATWRRAWRHYQGAIPFWPEWKRSGDWRRKTPDRAERRYWSGIFDRANRDEVDAWDYPWTACVWHNGGVTATPNVNLVSNIGFGPDATHTFAEEDLPGVPTHALGQLSHPSRIEASKKADAYVFDRFFGGANQRWGRRILRLPSRIRSILL